MTEKEITLSREEYRAVLSCIGFTMGAGSADAAGPFEYEEYEELKDEIIERWVSSE
jgi:hypothetical protein